MAQAITQTCDRCGNYRTLETNERPTVGGWRIIEDKELCAPCVAVFKVWVHNGPKDGD